MLKFLDFYKILVFFWREFHLKNTIKKGLIIVLQEK